MNKNKLIINAMVLLLSTSALAQKAGNTVTGQITPIQQVQPVPQTPLPIKPNVPSAIQLPQNNAMINNATPTTQSVNISTFDKIRSSGKVAIGYRTSSIPLSFVDANKKPVGYALDICLDLVNRMKTEMNLPDLRTEFVEVSSSNRIPLTVGGQVDIECGSTTNNATRRKEVDFSVPYYMAGIRIATKTKSGINSLADLKGKKVALTDKTSAVPIMEKINKDRDMKMTLVIEKDFPTAFNAIVTGKADAFVLDDLLLFGERSKVNNPQDYEIVGDFLSVEPISVMFRKSDPSFKLFIDKNMVDIINSGKINEYYTKWFQSPIPPNNKNLNIPKSAMLQDVLRMPIPVVGN